MHSSLACRYKWWVVGAFLVCSLRARVASADPTDLFGVDGRSQAMANAVVAESDSWSSPIYNPAGAAMGDRIEAGVGYTYAHAFATINGNDARVLDVRGISFGVVAPFEIAGEVKAGFGIAGYVPDYYLARVQMIPAYEPRFVLLDNRPNRLVITPVLALRWKYLSVGVGATILADAAGDGVLFNVGVKGGGKVGEAAIDLELPVRAAPVGGVQIGPIKGFKAGVAYRGELDLRMALDILANVDVAGIVTGDAVIAMRAVNYFTPRKLTTGVSYSYGDRLTVVGAVCWKQWSAFQGGVPEMRILVDLGLSPPMLQATFPPDNFHDTIEVGLGGEYNHFLDDGHEVAARLGYRFEPTPVPAQVGYSALLDNDRHVVTAGAGYSVERIASIFPYGLRLDVAFQYHHMVERADARSLRWSSPTGGVVYGGHILQLSASASLEF
jgi:long-chain fatty acid transport protein